MYNKLDNSVLITPALVIISLIKDLQFNGFKLIAIVTFFWQYSTSHLIRHWLFTKDSQHSLFFIECNEEIILFFKTNKRPFIWLSEYRGGSACFGI